MEKFNTVVSVIVKKIGVNIDAEAVEKNQTRFKNVLKDSSKRMETDYMFDSVALNGRGVERFVEEWGLDAMNDVMAATVTSSWIKEHLCSCPEITVQDVFDAIPAGGTISLLIELKTDRVEGTTSLYFVKEIEEGKGLGVAHLKVRRSEQTLIYED